MLQMMGARARLLLEPLLLMRLLLPLLQGPRVLPYTHLLLRLLLRLQVLLLM